MTNDKVYKLMKLNDTLMEVDSKCIESAIDYFLNFYPDFLNDKDFKIRVESKSFIHYLFLGTNS